MSPRGYTTGAPDDRERQIGDESLEELLSDPHCRYLLQYLRENEGPAELPAVARHVVAGITHTEPDEVTEDVQRRVQTWLHHGQLPRLDDHGVVDFDPDAGTVALADDPER